MNTSKALPPSAQIQWVEPAQSKKRKLPRLKPVDELGRLIDWYEKNRPDMLRGLPRRGIGQRRGTGGRSRFH